MRYISNTPAQQKEMLGLIGAASIEDLLARIPTKARLSRPLNLPAAMAETDLVRHLQRLAGRNAAAADYACFLGAGSYDHAIPSPINHLISRGEFFTAYTPYQPEASQGTLRSIFEYQTMMAELTGMDVANASIYDGASSLAEAVLMAHSVTGRDTILFSRGVNPLYRQVVETYAEGPGLRLKPIPLGDGVTDHDALRKALSKHSAAVVVQYPNFFGCLEDVRAAGEAAHEAGALLIVVAEPGRVRGPAGPGASHAGAPGGGDGRRGRPARLRAHPADARAAHPPREGHVEHLHQRGALRAHGHHLRRDPGQAGPAQGGRAVHREGALCGARARQDPRGAAPLRGAVLQGVHAPAA